MYRSRKGQINQFGIKDKFEIYSLFRAYVLLKTINIDRDIRIYFFFMKIIIVESKLLGGRPISQIKGLFGLFFINSSIKVYLFIIQLSLESDLGSITSIPNFFGIRPSRVKAPLESTSR